MAKVNGLPGFMKTRRTWTLTPVSSPISALTRSNSPIETPPLVTTTSLAAIRSSRSARRGSRSSGAFPDQTTSAPSPRRAAIRLNRFESRICPGPRGCPGSTSSSPVDRTLTRIRW